MSIQHRILIPAIIMVCTLIAFPEIPPYISASSVVKGTDSSKTLFSPNKPNFQTSQITASDLSSTDYCLLSTGYCKKNKPKQSQFRPKIVIPVPEPGQSQPPLNDWPLLASAAVSRTEGSFEENNRRNFLYNYVCLFYDASMSRNDTVQNMSGFSEMCEVLCKIRQPEQMQCFLEEVLTPAERKDLGLRWQLMEMLQEGIPQRKIAADLGISLCKITRGAKILRDPASVSQRYLESRRKK